MSVSLRMFDTLCEAGNAVASERNRFPEASYQWSELTQLLHGIDALIDALVCSDAIEDD